MVTKIVAVRAVSAPIGAFCTEFRCERFYDDDIFGEMDHRGREIDNWATFGPNKRFFHKNLPERGSRFNFEPPDPGVHYANKKQTLGGVSLNKKPSPGRVFY